MLAALTAWRCGVQNGAVLTGIQVPPLPLRLMVVQGTAGAAFGARPFLFVVMSQVDVHLALLQLQFHALDSPRIGDPQNTAVQFGILHIQIFPWGWVGGHVR
jgi:hypothetical protein